MLSEETENRSMKYIDEKEQGESSGSKVKVNAVKIILNFHVLLFRIQQAIEFYCPKKQHH